MVLCSAVRNRQLPSQEPRPCESYREPPSDTVSQEAISLQYSLRDERSPEASARWSASSTPCSTTPPNDQEARS